MGVIRFLRNDYDFIAFYKKTVYIYTVSQNACLSTVLTVMSLQFLES